MGHGFIFTNEIIGDVAAIRVLLYIIFVWMVYILALGARKYIASEYPEYLI